MVIRVSFIFEFQNYDFPAWAFVRVWWWQCLSWPGQSKFKLNLFMTWLFKVQVEPIFGSGSSLMFLTWSIKRLGSNLAYNCNLQRSTWEPTHCYPSRQWFRVRLPIVGYMKGLNLKSHLLLGWNFQPEPNAEVGRKMWASTPICAATLSNSSIK